MNDFKREERYIVVKLKDLDDVEIHNLKSYLEDEAIETVECVVVEKSFPIYEQVWKMIEDSYLREKSGRLTSD